MSAYVRNHSSALLERARHNISEHRVSVKALVKETAGPGFVLRDVPEPKIRDDEVLIRVRRAGVCGTDVHIYDWDAWAQGRCKPPFVVGHEFAGDVVQVGRLVTDVREGDRVTAEGHIVDGRCLLCRTGNAHVCPYTKIIGVDRDGCFAEYIAMPATNVWHLDDAICYEIGGIHDPMGNAFHTALTADIPGSTVLVTGCGPIGIFAVGICRAAGASRDHRVRRQSDSGSSSRKQMGAHDAVTPQEADAAVKRARPTDSASTSCSRCPACRARSIRRSRSCASAAECRCSAFPSKPMELDFADRDHLQGDHDLRRRRPPDVRHVASDDAVPPLRRIRSDAGDHTALVRGHSFSKGQWLSELVFMQSYLKEFGILLGLLQWRNTFL